jgi:starvation-inducible DNA-binding protein
MFETHNDLPSKTREQMIELLNACLADAIDLRTRIKVAHWNVKGLSFIGLHKLFDDVAEAVDEYSDLIGERATQLGGISAGTAREASERSALSEFTYPEQGNQEGYISAVAESLASFAAKTRAAIRISQDAGDDVTSEIFIDVTRGTDKWLWFVEAHRQVEEGARYTTSAETMSGKPLQH